MIFRIGIRDLEVSIIVPYHGIPSALGGKISQINKRKPQKKDTMADYAVMDMLIICEDMRLK